MLSHVGNEITASNFDIMPRNKKKRSLTDEDIIYAGAVYEEPGENEKRRSRRINKPAARPKRRKKSNATLKEEEEDIIGGELICPHPECKFKTYISERGCNITTCKNSHAHGGSFFYFCCHCKVECFNYIAHCSCSETVDIGTRFDEQVKRNIGPHVEEVEEKNEKNSHNPIVIDDGTMMVDREPSGEDDVEPEGIPNQVGHGDDGTTTPGYSSFTGTPSPSSSFSSSSSPADVETDEDALKPPAKSGIGSLVHVRNDDDVDQEIDRMSPDDTYPESQGRSQEVETMRGGAIAPSRSPFSGTPSPPSRLPSSSQLTDDETKSDILFTGGNRSTSPTIESEREDDVITVSGKVTHSATEYQVHPSDAASMDPMEEGTSNAISGDGSNGTDSNLLHDNRSLKSKKGQDDGSLRGIGIAESATETINQDDDGDDFPPPPLLPGRVVEARSLPITHKGGKFQPNDESWYEMLGKLGEYKEENGHCNVPNSEGSLGNWVIKQRYLYRKRDDGEQTPLTDERIAALGAMGFEWDGTGVNNPGNPNDELWYEMLGKLGEYKEENGHCNVPRSQGKLGQWVKNQRSEYQKRRVGKKTSLTDDRVAALESMEFEWVGTGTNKSGKSNDDLWNERLVELRDYKEENGNCNVPSSRGALSKWVSKQRSLYRKREDGEKTPLTDKRVAALDAIGFLWKLR